MATGIDPVPVGTLVIDCSSMADLLLDLAPGERSSKHLTHEGFAEAVLEIVSNQADFGAEIGITTRDIDSLTQANEQVARLDAVLPAARKLVEMLSETRHALDHKRHRQISDLAAIIDVRSRAESTPELRARYEKTRAYRSATANRAVATRRRNQQLQAETSGLPEDGPGDVATPPVVVVPPATAE